MRLTDNPILHTHATLARRQGFHLLLLAAGFVAVTFAWWSSQELAEALRRPTLGAAAMWAASTHTTLVLLQGTVAALGAVLVARAIANHRSRGLLEANRLTPMTPEDLAVGYWIGPLLAPLALIAIGTAYAVFLAVVSPHLSAVTVVKTQALVFTTTLLGGLVAAWLALELHNPSRAVPVLILGAMGISALAGLGESFVGNFLIGLPAVIEAMAQRGAWSGAWTPTLFGVGVDAVATAIGVQAFAASVCWVSIARKLRNPSGAGLSRATMALVFVAAVGVQYGLLHASFVEAAADRPWDTTELARGLYGFLVFAVTLTAAVAASSAADVRRRAFSGTTDLAAHAVRSGIPTALSLALVGGAFLVIAPGVGASRAAAATFELASCAVLLTAIIEAGRFSESRRAGTLLVLALGALFLVPIAAAVMGDDEMAATTLGVSGALLLEDPGLSYDTHAVAGLALHAFVALTAVAAWQRQLRGILARAAAAST